MSTMVIDCPFCDVRAKCEIIGEVYDPSSGTFEPIAVFLLKCPSCNNAILAQAHQDMDERNNYYWGRIERVWPYSQNIELSKTIPELIRKDIEDALKCLKNGIFSASAVLCGRALERIIVERTNEKTIAKGLRKLKDDGTIDQKLFEWAEALRYERNIGAHASMTQTTRDNAQDVLDFLIAICDYIYTMNDKYDKYMRRKKNISQEQTAEIEAL
jgi:hypothetical protein